MRLQFTTSVGSVHGGSFIEGRIIEVAKLTPDLKRWLEAGVLKPLNDAPDQVADEPSDPERAVTPRGSRRRSETLA